jgi:hypothetical protein
METGDVPTFTQWHSIFTAKQDALGFTPLNPANNLSDLMSASTAKQNLGLTSLATAPAVFVYGASFVSDGGGGGRVQNGGAPAAGRAGGKARRCWSRIRRCETHAAPIFREKEEGVLVVDLTDNSGPLFSTSNPGTFPVRSRRSSAASRRPRAAALA